MKTNWKILKVFLSSTFKDLEITRDRLTNIFEKIEHSVLKRSLTIRPYDLRWRDRHSQESIVEWCIRMVNQCDYFVGILGNRYGWRPPKKIDGKKNNANISMTEMEIKEALQKIPRKNRFFCFTTFQDLKDETSEDLASMEKLKQFLKNQKETVFTCNTLDDVLICIEQNFSKIIDQQYPENAALETQQLSRFETIDEFIEEKLSGFVGREEDIEQLQNFVHSEDRSNYFIVKAVAGTGKSALVGRFLRTMTKTKTLAHFLSIDGSAREVREILSSFVDQMRSHNIISEEPKGDIKALINQLQEGLESYQKKLILLIDGIDEVEEDGRSLFWLPRNIPSNIRVVITTRPVDTLRILRKYPFIQEKELQALRPQEITQIINNYMQQHTLDYDEQDREILQKNCAGNPLYLKVGLDELRASGTSVAQLAMTVDTLFHQILNRLEQKYQKQFDDNDIDLCAKQFFEKYLGFIAAGRTGVLEKEIQDILKIGDDLMLPISQSLSNFIITRSGFLNFFHPEFERTIKARIGKQNMRDMHTRLAQYFNRKGLNYIRTLDELPYQLQWSEQYSELIKLLTSISFLQNKGQRNLMQGLREDFRFALDGQAVRVPQNCNVELSPEITVNRKTLQLIQKALEIDFHLLQHQPENIFHCLWNRCYWHDCPELEQRYKVTFKEPENEKIYRLAQKWHSEIPSGHLWLKSLRPLPQRIDSSIKSTIRGHRKAILQVRVWKHKLASVSRDHTVKIWDLKTGVCLLTLRHDHQVNSVSWHPDGEQLVSASEDGNVTIWNAQTGEKMTNWDHPSSVNSVDWNINGTHIASGARDGIVRVWNVIENQLEHELLEHKGGVFYVSWNKEGTLLASSSKDKNIAVWDWKKQLCIALLKGHKEKIFSLDWSYDGKLASASDDGEVRVWQYQKEKCTFIFRNHTNSVNDVSWHPNKLLLASASEDRTIRIWNIKERKQQLCLKSSTGKINCVSWTSSNDLISGESNSFIQVWDPQPVAFDIPFEENNYRIRKMAWHPQGNYVASIQNSKIQIWDILNVKVHLEIKTNPQTVDAVWINESELATFSTKITIWEWQKPKRLEEFDVETHRQSFKKWKSCAKISSLYAVQIEEQRTLLMCDEGKMSYFPAPLKNAVCLESGYLCGHSLNYLYLFKIEKS